MHSHQMPKGTISESMIQVLYCVMQYVMWCNVHYSSHCTLLYSCLVTGLLPLHSNSIIHLFYIIFSIMFSDIISFQFVFHFDVGSSQIE